MFRGTDAVAQGLLTRDALRSRCRRRLLRDVHADAALPDDQRLRLAGAALFVPSDAVVSGRSAAYLLGLREAVAEATPVEVTVPSARRFGPVAGLRVRWATVPDGDVTARGRHRCTSAGLPPVPQCRVSRADGVFVARVVLAYPAAKVAVEYDGAWHGAPGELRRDRRRINALVAAGWRVRYVTAAGLYRPDEVVARVRTLLAAAEIGGPGHSAGH